MVFYSTQQFEETFTYEGNDLGAVWSKEKTVFRLWAPTAQAVWINLYKSDTPETSDLLEQIQAAQAHLKALIDEHAPTVTVTAVTAVPMNGLMRAKVMATAQKILHSQVFLRERVDPSILGGVVLETPTRRFDASVATQLSNVHKELITATEEGGA